ncbi:N-acetyl-6-hydroxytryptophan oxidase ivoB [Fusarium oxysporum f. sp. albedinis]|nr:N-acetyl-6-hydroxytryptophan oxidase ivoB [Fusarium oxysporum f. sp. albedinis]
MAQTTWESISSVRKTCLASGVTNSVLEMLQRPNKKPRFKHIIYDPTGHDLCLPLIINGEAPKLPRSLQ